MKCHTSINFLLAEIFLARVNPITFKSVHLLQAQTVTWPAECCGTKALQTQLRDAFNCTLKASLNNMIF